MAFNEILEGRLNRFLQKRLVIKNTALRSLAPDLQCVLPLLEGAEDRYLDGWNRYAQDFSVAALAANFSIGEIRNPKPSNLILVIESVLIRNTSGANAVTGISLQAATTDQGTVSTGQVIRLDPRGGPTPAAVLSVGTAASAPVTNAANMFVALTVFSSFQAIQDPQQEWTVLPGDAFFVFGQAVNQALTVSIEWRERILESSELT